MATKLVTKTAIPEGFESPFKRVQMTDRNGDSLACVATLSGRSIEEVNAAAIEMGLPATGPYFVDGVLLAKLLMKLGGLVASNYKEFHSYDALPDVAILLVRYSYDLEIGLHCLWHHVRAATDTPSFSYIIDVGDWIRPNQYFNTSFDEYEPAYFIEVTAPVQRNKK